MGTLKDEVELRFGAVITAAGVAADPGSREEGKSYPLHHLMGVFEQAVLGTLVRHGEMSVSEIKRAMIRDLSVDPLDTAMQMVVARLKDKRLVDKGTRPPSGIKGERSKQVLTINDDGRAALREACAQQALFLQYCLNGPG